jgi:hypothetical protein
MSRLVAAILGFTLLASTCLMAADGPAGPAGPTKPKKPAAKQATLSEQLQALRDQLNQQQMQIKQQQDQIQQLQKQLQQNSAQMQQQGQQLQSAVQQASQQAATAQQTASTVSSNFGELKTSTATFGQNLQETQKAVKELQSPLAIHYKGLSLTPGGFLTADFLVRSRNENADVTSSFGNVPFGNIANSHLTEFRASSRASRISLLAEGKSGDTKLSGYYEMDFVSPSLSNYIEVNAWNPRVRQAWAQADFANGTTLTAGQMWSLLVTNRKGIATRAELIPNTMEASYVVGWTYVRQADLRITKNFNNKTWVAFEIANPETTLATSFTPNGLFGFANSPNALSPNGNTVNFLGGTCPAAGGSGTGSTTLTACNPAAAAISSGLSTNIAPDLIAKVAFEPGWGHYEIKAIGRFFRSRIAGNTNVTEGGGGGAAAILPIVRNKADFIIEGLVGTGIGRYGAANNADVTVRPDGFVIPLKALHAFGGLELHPTPKLDWFFYGGDEYYKRANYVSPTGGPAGYGSALVNNTSCNQDFIVAGTCGAQNKNIFEGSTGFWYRLYRGNFGTFQYGMQYEYIKRNTYSGRNTLTGLSTAPKGLDNIFFTSFRFILP